MRISLSSIVPSSFFPRKTQLNRSLYAAGCNNLSPQKVLLNLPTLFASPTTKAELLPKILVNYQ